MEKEGIHWAKSKERRELERRKLERIRIGQVKKIELNAKLEKNRLQRKITESLAELPENRQIILRREEEKERLITLQEAKKELWKRWRQKKGKGFKLDTIRDRDDEENLEKKLRKVELEVARYREELEEKERKETQRRNQKQKKEAKEKHWEMIKWIVSFIEQNKEEWDRRRREEIAEREAKRKLEEWRSMTKLEKLEKLRDEEAKTRNLMKSNKENRLEAARKLKEVWSSRRKVEEEADDEDEDIEREVELARELEDEETYKDFIEEAENFCLNCAMRPCVCILTYLDLKIKTMGGGEGKELHGANRDWRKRRRSSEDEQGAGHQHHELHCDADAQQEVWGQLQHQPTLGVGVASVGGGENTGQNTPDFTPRKRQKMTIKRENEKTLPEAIADVEGDDVPLNPPLQARQEKPPQQVPRSPPLPRIKSPQGKKPPFTLKKPILLPRPSSSPIGSLYLNVKKSQAMFAKAAKPEIQSPPPSLIPPPCQPSSPPHSPHSMLLPRPSSSQLGSLYSNAKKSLLTPTCPPSSTPHNPHYILLPRPSSSPLGSLYSSASKPSQSSPSPPQNQHSTLLTRPSPSPLGSLYSDKSQSSLPPPPPPSHPHNPHPPPSTAGTSIYLKECRMFKSNPENENVELHYGELLVGEQPAGGCAAQVPSSQADLRLSHGRKAYQNSSDQARQGKTEVDVVTAEKYSQNNLMRSGNITEKVEKPNPTVYTRKKETTEQNLDQYRIDCSTVKRKSFVREAILKLSENSNSEKNATFNPPDAKCENM